EHIVRFRWRAFLPTVRFSEYAWDETSGQCAKCHSECCARRKPEAQTTRDNRPRSARWKFRKWPAMLRRRKEKPAGCRLGPGRGARNAGSAARSCRRDEHEERTRRIGG